MRQQQQQQRSVLSTYEKATLTPELSRVSASTPPNSSRADCSSLKYGTDMRQNSFALSPNASQSMLPSPERSSPSTWIVSSASASAADAGGGSAEASRRCRTRGRCGASNALERAAGRSGAWKQLATARTAARQQAHRGAMCDSSAGGLQLVRGLWS